MKLKHILILQNKIDLVKEGQAKEQHEQIVKFVQGTVAEGAPIIPISAQLKYNIEVNIHRQLNQILSLKPYKVINLVYRQNCVLATGLQYLPVLISRVPESTMKVVRLAS